MMTANIANVRAYDIEILCHNNNQEYKLGKMSKD